MTAINPELPMPADAIGVTRARISASEIFTGVAPVETADSPAIKIFSSEDPIAGDLVAHEARKLHTELYLRDGLVNESDLDTDGLYRDAFTDRAVYFYVENGTKDSAARLIMPSIKLSKEEKKLGLTRGISSLPTIQHFSCDPEVLRVAAKVDNLGELKPGDAVEISGLASKPHSETGEKNHGGLDMDASISLYTDILRFSLEKGHRLWVQNVEPRFVDYLSRLIGKDQVHTLGEPQEYMGPPTVPVALNPSEIVRKIYTSDDVVSKMIQAQFNDIFAGMNADKLDKDIRKILQNAGVPLTRSGILNRIVRHEQFVPQALIGSYSLARAVPASFVPEFEGSFAALWGIDVGTSVPYAWGLVNMIKSRDTKKKLIGASVAFPSFLAPYTYWYTQGEGYPDIVNYGVGAMVTAGVASAVMQRRSLRKAEKTLTEQLQIEDHPTSEV